MISTQEVVERPFIPAAARVAYGAAPQQFGDLYLPPGAGPHPLLVAVHGGCWLSEYDLRHLSGFCTALAQTGCAVWSLEYRRMGDAGGGWPGTLQDVAAGAAFVGTLARDYPLDLTRMAAIGHSAGGQLALWLAAWGKVRDQLPFATPEPLPWRGVIALAGIPDLAQAAQTQVCDDAVVRLLDGTPAERPLRYALASPQAQLPLGVPQRLLIGAKDPIVPPALVAAYVAAARAAGDDVTLTQIPEAGHFELIVPGTAAWRVVETAVAQTLGS